MATLTVFYAIAGALFADFAERRTRFARHEDGATVWQTAVFLFAVGASWPVLVAYSLLSGEEL